MPTDATDRCQQCLPATDSLSARSGSHSSEVFRTASLSPLTHGRAPAPPIRASPSLSPHSSMHMTSILHAAQPRDFPLQTLPITGLAHLFPLPSLSTGKIRNRFALLVLVIWEKELENGTAPHDVHVTSFIPFPDKVCTDTGRKCDFSGCSLCVMT